MQGVADALPARRAIALTFTGMVAAAPNMRLRLSGSGVVSSTRTALAPASGVSASSATSIVASVMPWAVTRSTAVGRSIACDPSAL